MDDASFNNLKIVYATESKFYFERSKFVFNSSCLALAAIFTLFNTDTIYRNATICAGWSLKIAFSLFIFSLFFSSICQILCTNFDKKRTNLDVSSEFLKEVKKKNSVSMLDVPQTIDKKSEKRRNAMRFFRSALQDVVSSGNALRYFDISMLACFVMATFLTGLPLFFLLLTI